MATIDNNLLSPSAQSDATTNTDSASPAPSQLSLQNTSVSSIATPPTADADSPDELKDQLDDNKPTVIHCRWEGCTMTFTNPEAIYTHLCDDHVGRKSTGNLCLTCKWVDCEFSCTAKRHHITSHLIVHAPFKPHGCKQCKKSFKRPQDLKKHERTHQQRPTVDYQHLYNAQMMANAPYGYQPQPMIMTTGDGRFYTVSPTAPPTAVAGMYPMQMQMAYPPVSYPALPQHQHAAAAVQHGLYPIIHSATHRPAPSLQVPATREGGPARESEGLSPRSAPTQLRSASVTIPNNSYLALADHGRSKSTSAAKDNDTNSYGYLAHGSSSVAGVKREYDDVGGFFNDVRAKRVAPTYDHAMAQRLCATFGGETIVDPRWMSDDSSSESGSPAMQSRSTQPNVANKQQRPAVPINLQGTDVAQLNAFLLQLGSSAAAAGGTAESGSFDGSSAESMTSGSSAASSPPSFDLSALHSYGLTDIPGFDESLLSAPLSGEGADGKQHQQHDYIGQEYNHYNGAALEHQSRPIASLPSRAAPNSAPSFPRPAYAPLHPPTFDSIRTSRDPPLVPQLSPNDAVPHFSYRHVEPLTRAALSTHIVEPVDTASNVKAPAASTESPPTRSRSSSSSSSESSDCSTCIADNDSHNTSPAATELDLASLKLGDLKLSSSTTDDAQIASAPLPTADLRHAHIKLILDLLVAINRPKSAATAGDNAQEPVAT